MTTEEQRQREIMLARNAVKKLEEETRSLDELRNLTHHSLGMLELFLDGTLVAASH